MTRVPVVRVIGKRGLGKTRLITRITSELVHRGYRVSVIKHTVHRSSFDQPGKDTWRFSRAGAHMVALCGANEIVTIRKTEKELSLEDVMSRIDTESDIVLVEGFKEAKGPRIEILGPGDKPPDIDGLLAVISDIPLTIEVPRFGIDDLVAIVDLLESKYLRSR